MLRTLSGSSGEPRLRLFLPGAGGAPVDPAAARQPGADLQGRDCPLLQSLFDRAMEAHLNGKQPSFWILSSGLAPLRAKFEPAPGLAQAAALADLPPGLAPILAAKKELAEIRPQDEPIPSEPDRCHEAGAELSCDAPSMEEILIRDADRGYGKPACPCRLVCKIQGQTALDCPARISETAGSNGSFRLDLLLLDPKERRWVHPDIFYPSGEFADEDDPDPPKPTSGTAFDEICELYWAANNSGASFSLLAIPDGAPELAIEASFEHLCYETAGSGACLSLPEGCMPVLALIAACERKALRAAALPPSCGSPSGGSPRL